MAKTILKWHHWPFYNETSAGYGLWAARRLLDRWDSPLSIQAGLSHGLHSLKKYAMDFITALVMLLVVVVTLASLPVWLPAFLMQRHRVLTLLRRQHQRNLAEAAQAKRAAMNWHEDSNKL